MSLHTLFQLGITTVASRNSQTEEQRKEIPAPHLVSPLLETPFAIIRAVHYASRRFVLRLASIRQSFFIPTGRQHAPQHPSLAFIHDRSLRYGI